MGETMDEYELKNLIEKLENIRGRNTELVSLYVPAGYNMPKIIDFLTAEVSEADNIKSKSTRKNVQSALDKIKRRLKEVGKTPENGVAMFAGNVSEQEGRPDIQMWEVVPPEPVQSRRYRCDKDFVLDPLRDLVIEDEIYGMIVVDKSEAAIGYLKGNNMQIIHELESNVPGKTTKGGQCLSADTRIPLPDGSIRPISELDENEKMVVSAAFEHNDVRGAEHNTVFASEHEHVYTVKTRNPQRSLQVTGNHRVFVFGDAGIGEKFVEDLCHGDYLIGTRNIDIGGEIQEIDVDIPARFVVTPNGADRLREQREQRGLSQAELGEMISVSQTAISKFECGDRNPSYSTIQDLLDALELSKEFIEGYCRKEPAFTLPETVTPELAQFLGYFQGDGAIDGNRLEFYEQREAVAEAYAALFEQLFDLRPTVVYREDKNYYRIRVYSHSLVKRMQEAFPRAFRSGGGEMPRSIQRSPDEVVAGYLQGLFDAEGSVSTDEITISMTAETLIQDVMLTLQRFGIVASITDRELDITHLRGEKNRSNQTRLRISERGSLERFQQCIGFTSSEKQDVLQELVASRTGRARSDKIPVSGQSVRALAEQLGMNTQDFTGFNPYFRNEKLISYDRFTSGILPTFEQRVEELKGSNDDRAQKAEEILTHLKQIAEGDLVLSKVEEIERTEISEPREFYDIDVPGYRNFVANGLVVHNSQQRFERIRENMYDTFLSQIAEKAQQEFLEKARDGELLGLLIGGPGFAKDDLVDKNYLHQELVERVLVRKGTNYSGEEGMHELMNKAEDVIQESRAIQEQRLVQEFLTNLKEDNGLSTYGLREVAKALQMGAVDDVLISEDLNMYEIHYECNEEEHVEYLREDEIDDLKCDNNATPDITQKRDVIDVLKEKANQMDSTMHIISSQSKEGKRLKNMGGVAAILRYRIS